MLEQIGIILKFHIRVKSGIFEIHIGTVFQ